MKLLFIALFTACMTLGGFASVSLAALEGGSGANPTAYAQSSYYTQGGYSSKLDNTSKDSGDKNTYGQGTYSSSLFGNSLSGGGDSGGKLDNTSGGSSLSGGSSSSGNSSYTPPPCALCEVAQSVLSAISSGPSAIVKAGNDVVDAVKNSLGVEKSDTFAQLPQVQREPTKIDQKPDSNGGSITKNPTQSDQAPIPDSILQVLERQKVIEQELEVYTPEQTTARNLAQIAGFDISSPAVEGAVFLSLQKNNNNPSAAIEDLKRIEAQTGADLNSTIKGEVALFGSTNSSASKALAALGITQEELLLQMTEIDERIKEASAEAQQKLDNTQKEDDVTQNGDPSTDGVNDPENQENTPQQDPQEIEDTPVQADDIGEGATWEEIRELNGFRNCEMIDLGCHAENLNREGQLNAAKREAEIRAGGGDPNGVLENIGYNLGWWGLDSTTECGADLLCNTGKVVYDLSEQGQANRAQRENTQQESTKTPTDVEVFEDTLRTQADAYTDYINGKVALEIARQEGLKTEGDPIVMAQNEAAIINRYRALVALEETDPAISADTVLRKELNDIKQTTPQLFGERLQEDGVQWSELQAFRNSGYIAPQLHQELLVEQQTYKRDVQEAVASALQKEIEEKLAETCLPPTVCTVTVTPGEVPRVRIQELTPAKEPVAQTETEAMALRVAQEFGLDTSDPQKAYFAILLTNDRNQDGTAKVLTESEYRERLKTISDNTTNRANMPALVVLFDDFANGTNNLTFKDPGLLGFLANEEQKQFMAEIPKGEGGFTHYIRTTLNNDPDLRRENGGNEILPSDASRILAAKASEYFQALQGSEEEQSTIEFTDIAEVAEFLDVPVETYTSNLANVRPEVNYTPVANVAQEPTVSALENASCNWLCSAVTAPFGGVEGARRTLTQMVEAAQAQTSSETSWSLPVTGIDSIDDIPTSGGSANSREFDPNNRGGRGHTGLDVPAPKGSPLFAIEGGTVIEVWGPELSGYGRTVVIQNADGETWSYSHNDSNNVKKGQVVKAGDVIGTVGDSGNAKGGFPHTHIQYYPKPTEDGKTGWDKAIALGIRKGALLNVVEMGRDDVVADPRERMAQLAVESEQSRILTASDEEPHPLAQYGQTALNLFNVVFPRQEVTIENPESVPYGPASAGTVSTQSTNTSSDGNTTQEAPQSLTQTASCVGIAFVSLNFSALGSCFSGGGAVVYQQPASSLVSPSDSLDTTPSDTSTPTTPEEAVANLTVEATTATKGTSEYRFRGFLVRSIALDSDLPLRDLQDNFSAIVENTLNVDYNCDGSIDVQKTFTLPYLSFTFDQEESSILISEYLPVSQAGAHCFFFDADTTNVIKETDESNRSNKQVFVAS